MDKIQLIIQSIETVKDDIDTIKKTIAPRYGNKCDRVKNDTTKAQEVLCGLLLRDYLNVTSDEQLSVNEYGKPKLADGSMHFNLSHSGSYVVLAISPHPVGVDIEQVKRGNMKIAKRAFPADWIYGLNNSADDGSAAFYENFSKYWTLYEAAIKQIGCGFSKKVADEDIIALTQNSYTMSFDGYTLSVVSSMPFEVEYHLINPSS